MASVPEILDLIRSTNDEDREDGLGLLCDIVDASYGEDGAALGMAVREGDGISLLAWLLVDPSTVVQQEALLILGNLCSDACDPYSIHTKRKLLECGAHRALVHVIKSNDPAVLVYACGCLQNLCHDDEWARILVQQKVEARLEALLAHEDQMVVHYAAGALKNIVNRVGGEMEAVPLSDAAKSAVEQRDVEAKVNNLRVRRAKRIIRDGVRPQPRHHSPPPPPPPRRTLYPRAPHRHPSAHHLSSPPPTLRPSDPRDPARTTAAAGALHDQPRDAPAAEAAHRRGGSQVRRRGLCPRRGCGGKGEAGGGGAGECGGPEGGG